MLLVARCSSLVARRWSLVAGRSLLAAGRSLLAARCSSLVAGCSSLVARRSCLLTGLGVAERSIQSVGQLSRPGAEVGDGKVLGGRDVAEALCKLQVGFEFRV